MRKYLNERDTINSILLDSRHPLKTNSVWILVEGESDLKIFRKLLNHKNVEVNIAYGNTGLDCSIKELSAKINRVAGIRDADFMHLDGISEKASNIFLTDYHDVEIMMIASDATLSSIMNEYCSRTIPNIQEFRLKIMSSIKFLGTLRWYNNKWICKFNFEGLGLGKIYDGQRMLLDREACINEINKRSSSKTQDALLNKIEELSNATDDLLNLCNGHDLTHSIAIYCNAQNKKGVSGETIERGLRIAYSVAEFQKTVLWKSLRNWFCKYGISLDESERNNNV